MHGEPSLIPAVAIKYSRVEQISIGLSVGVRYWLILSLSRRIILQFTTGHQKTKKNLIQSTNIRYNKKQKCVNPFLNRYVVVVFQYYRRNAIAFF